MQTIQFRRQPNFLFNQYCILQFKGKFQSDSQDPQNQQKSLISLGQLKHILTQQGKYKLQIGIMDLIGKQVELLTKQLVTQTVIGKDNMEKIVVIKGVVKKKIVFENRPAPDMERVVIGKKQGNSHKMFLKVEEKNLVNLQQQNLHESNNVIGK